MILLAGLLLVMAYLIFSTQTALLATVGQEAGREASNPLFADFVGIRTGLAQVMEQELTGSDGTTVTCPTRLTLWQGRVDTMMAMITQLESNRGQSFHGVFIDADNTADLNGDATLDLMTQVELYLSDGDASILEEVRFYTFCD